MGFYKDAMPVDEIRQILSQRLHPLSPESISLATALGRTAADTICATHDVPSFDKSAMDGYAIHTADLSGGVLEPVGESLIGKALNLTLARGQTIYVSTGAPVPFGTAAVVPIEQVRSFDDAVFAGPSPDGKHIVRRGERIREGQTVLAAGEEIDLAKITMLASQRVKRVSVVRRPSVAFFATGDELSGTPDSFEVIDAITPAVQAWCQSQGFEIHSCTHLADDLDLIGQSLNEAQADLIITSGGASVGRKDFTRCAVANLAEIIVPGICVKPGSPAFVAVRGPQIFLGLPGNPHAAAYQLDLLGGMIATRLTGR